MGRHRSYTDDKAIEAIRASYSIAQALTKLGLAPQGGNYATMHRIVKTLHLNTSHFTGQAWNKGKTVGPKRQLEDYFSNKIPIHSTDLRKKLLAAGVFEPKCDSCKNTTWMGCPIPLELEHKDGNHRNNARENLCLLCPNCHALTPTYRNKKRRGHRFLLRRQ